MYYDPIRPPLSDTELDALHGLLEMRAVPFKGMSLEMLDGFLSALAVGPESVPDEEWMPQVWGRQAAALGIARGVRGHVRGQLIALWNDVVRRMAIEPEEQSGADLPLIATLEADATEPDDTTIASAPNGPPVSSTASELRGDAWDAWIRSDQWIDEGAVVRPGDRPWRVAGSRRADGRADLGS